MDRDARTLTCRALRVCPSKTKLWGMEMDLGAVVLHGEGEMPPVCIPLLFAWYKVVFWECVADTG